MESSTKPAKNPSTLEIDLPLESQVGTDELRKIDRCDQCSAPALVRAVKGDSSLLFCGSHAKRNIDALVHQGWLIDDQSARIILHQ